MERCPICRARLNETTTCRRCRAELGSAQAAEALARRLEGRAMHRLAIGDDDAAARLLRRSLRLHASPQARDLARALERRRGAGSTGGGTDVLALETGDGVKEMQLW